MDVAYDHIQEENLSPSEESSGGASSEQSTATATNLNAEFAEAYKAISSSPWGSRLGGILASARKQGESYYEDARKEYTAASAQASRGMTELRTTILSRARGLSLSNPTSPNPDGGSGDTEKKADDSSTNRDASENSANEGEPSAAAGGEAPERPESLPADIVKEAEGMLSRFRSEASKRLRDMERAEDAADEALLKFGSNIRNFLREAVTIAPPPTEDDILAAGGMSNLDPVLFEQDASSGTDGKGAGAAPPTRFESRDTEGRRVIHPTRFDAQLHAIHCSPDSFVRDPPSGAFDQWAANEFGDVAAPARTEQIARDLEKHEELRRAMERLVPERVDYATFWKRYYFLRHVVETEEARRREMLKGAANDDDEEVAWDEDSDSDAGAGASSANNPAASASTPTTASDPSGAPAKSLSSSKETLTGPSSDDPPKITEPRRSHDAHSQPDSDASYDLVSGATSRAPGSPHGEAAAAAVKKEGKVDEESDEDWE